MRIPAGFPGPTSQSPYCDALPRPDWSLLSPLSEQRAVSQESALGMFVDLYCNKCKRGHQTFPRPNTTLPAGQGLSVPESRIYLVLNKVWGTPE